MRYGEVGTGVMLLLCLGGCASVKSIEPVAQANIENSTALRTNFRTFIAATSGFFRANLKSELYRQKAKVVRRVPRNQSAPTFQARAQQLNGLVQPMSIEAKERQIRTFHYSEPLAAAVAFSSLSAADAAAVSSDLGGIWGSGADPETKMKQSMVRLASLAAMRSLDRAAADADRAYGDWISKLDSQLERGQKLAESLAKAANAAPDPSVLLEGVLGDENLTHFIATRVKDHTDDPARRDAAERILAGIGKDESR